MSSPSSLSSLSSSPSSPSSPSSYDAVIVGSGPNGLAAAITLAQAGLSVAVFEAKSTIGGGMRSAEITLPGFIHDICSAVHPLGIGSPFFASLPLQNYGLQWIQPQTPLAHPFENGSAITLEKSIETTIAKFTNQSPADATAYKNLMDPFVKNWEKLAPDILAPLHFPAHPLLMARFGYYGIQSAQGLALRTFKTQRVRSLFAGLAAHAIMPLDMLLTSAFGIILGTLGHAVGWPFPRKGSQSIANALAAYLQSLGGKIFTNTNITSIDQLPKSHFKFFDVTPKQLLAIVGDRFPESYRRRLEKYQYGPGVFKIDWALSDPIPWRAQECSQAGTVHLGGTLEDIARSERKVWEGKIPDKSFIILAQPSLFDPTRAPEDKHTAWAYCHVPNGSIVDMTKQIENQIEEAAPGFKDCILAKSTKNAPQFEQYNPNYIGGDINGGVEDLGQLFTRPVARWNPYSTPLKGVYICSASTPPGGGVHGMCGYHAARSALKAR